MLDNSWAMDNNPFVLTDEELPLEEKPIEPEVEEQWVTKLRAFCWKIGYKFGKWWYS